MRLRSRDVKRLRAVTGLCGDGSSDRIRELARELSELLLAEYGPGLLPEEISMLRARMAGTTDVTMQGDAA